MPDPTTDPALPDGPTEDELADVEVGEPTRRQRLSGAELELEAARRRIAELEARGSSGAEETPERPEPIDTAAEDRLRADATADGSGEPHGQYEVLVGPFKRADDTTYKAAATFTYAGERWAIPRLERLPARAMRALDRGALWDAFAIGLDKAMGRPPLDPRARLEEPPTYGERFLATDVDVMELTEILVEIAEAQGADPEPFRALAPSSPDTRTP